MAPNLMREAISCAGEFQFWRPGLSKEKESARDVYDTLLNTYADPRNPTPA